MKEIIQIAVTKASERGPADAAVLTCATGEATRYLRAGEISAIDRAKVVMKTRRWAATNVDPATGVRDLGIRQASLKHSRHVDLAMYAQISARRRMQPEEILQLAV